MTKKKQPATQVQMLPMSAVEVNAGQLQGLPANPREIRDENGDLIYFYTPKQ